MTVFNRYQNCYTEEKGKWRRNMDMSNAAIGGRIRQAREERGYTREKLAELADILKISKSCLNHRLRKIIEIADEL